MCHNLDPAVPYHFFAVQFLWTWRVTCIYIYDFYWLLWHFDMYRGLHLILLLNCVYISGRSFDVILWRVVMYNVQTSKRPKTLASTTKSMQRTWPGRETVVCLFVCLFYLILPEELGRSDFYRYCRQALVTLKGILWDRWWSTPSIRIFPTHADLFTVMHF